MTFPPATTIRRDSGIPTWPGVALGIVLFAAFFHHRQWPGRLRRFRTNRGVSCSPTVMPKSVDTSAYLAPMAGGDQNPLDHTMVWMTLGVIAGGFTSGWLGGRVKVETFKGPQVDEKTRWGLALLGGVLMGVGARFARGCTSGQALSGGAVLSVGSWGLHDHGLRRSLHAGLSVEKVVELRQVMATDVRLQAEAWTPTS